MIQPPFFSIIVPTYNRADLIEKTISSFLNQTFDDFEIIIVDDGSTDNTKEIIQQISDPKIKYFHKTNGQMGSARNFGTKQAKGKYLNFFDSDDLAYPIHLQTAFDFIDKKENPIVFHLHYDIKNAQGAITRTPIHITNLKKQLLYDNPLSINSVFIKKEAAAKNQFNEDYNLAGSADYLMWLQLISKFNFLSGNTITSTIITHTGRSVYNYNRAKITTRVEVLVKYIFQDSSIKAFYGKKINTILGMNYSYLALHLVLEKYKYEGIKYLAKSLFYFPNFIFKKRFYAIIKHLII